MQLHVSYAKQARFSRSLCFGNKLQIDCDRVALPAHLVHGFLDLGCSFLGPSIPGHESIDFGSGQRRETLRIVALLTEVRHIKVDAV